MSDVWGEYSSLGGSCQTQPKLASAWENDWDAPGDHWPEVRGRLVPLCRLAHGGWHPISLPFQPTTMSTAEYYLLSGLYFTDY